MSLIEKIVRFIESKGVDGASYTEIHVALNLPRVQVDHQLKSMVDDRLIYRMNGSYCLPRVIQDEPMPDVPGSDVTAKKRCKECQNEKPACEFYENHAKCKSCTRERQKSQTAERKLRIAARASDEGRTPRSAVKPLVVASMEPSVHVAAKLKPALIIPATAEISVRHYGVFIGLRADASNEIKISPSQLDVICDWWKATRVSA